MGSVRSWPSRQGRSFIPTHVSGSIRTTARSFITLLNMEGAVYIQDDSRDYGPVPTGVAGHEGARVLIGTSCTYPLDEIGVRIVDVAPSRHRPRLSSEI